MLPYYSIYTILFGPAQLPVGTDARRVEWRRPRDRQLGAGVDFHKLHNPPGYRIKLGECRPLRLREFEYALGRRLSNLRLFRAAGHQ